MPPWWSGRRSTRDVGNLGARAKLVQGTAARLALDTSEEGVSVREGKHGKVTITKKVKTPDAPPEAAANDADIFDYFMKVGAEFKGQLQSCYDLIGKSVEAAVAIDPGQIMLPGGTCSVEAGVKASNSSATLLTVMVHPSLDNEKPICFGTLLGAFRTLDITVGAEVGVKAPEVLPEIPDGLAEVASWELEAKATLRGDAKYSGEYLHVSDPAPRFYSREEVRTTLRDDFSAVRSGATVKLKAKRDACSFCNENKQYFGEASIETFFGGHISSSKLIAQLEKGVLAIHGKAQKERRALISPEERIIGKARALICDLQPFLETFPFREYCSLRAWGHRAEASASIAASAKFSAKMEVGGAQSLVEGATGVEIGDYAEAEIETSIDERISAGVSVEAEAKVTAVEVGGSLKKTLYRYQGLTYVAGSGGAKRQLVMTQDTTITYKQALLSGLKLEVKLEGSANVAGQGVEGGVGAELQPSWAKREYNTMSYVSGTVYWHPDGDAPELYRIGSGYSFGQSCSLSNVLRLGSYNAGGELTLKTDPATLNYCKALALRLRVTQAQVQAFLTGGGLSMCEALTHDPNVNPGAVLIEASFGAQPALKWRKGLIQRASNQIDDFRDATITAGAGARERSLQAIRLRFRIADTAVRDETKFKLGFKLLGNGVGIALGSVDRAGSEGVVDLTTVWFNELASFNGRNSSEGYEQSVPPVALLSQ